MKHAKQLVTALCCFALVACVMPKTDWQRSDQIESFTSAQKECESRKLPCTVYYWGSDEEFDYFSISRMNILFFWVNRYLATKRGLIPIEKRTPFTGNPRNLVVYPISK